MSDWEPPKDARIIIVCAANKLPDGTLITGPRHCDSVMRKVMEKIYPQEDRVKAYSDSEQGFVDQWGKFYNRKEAWKIVQENGQPFNLIRNGASGLLFSEGLY